MNGELKGVALEAANDLCHQNDSALLYLTVFGSRLYGTSTGSSDFDVRGIFLPSLPAKILGDAKRSLHYSTCAQAARNSASDIDIDLWSLDYWLLKLLPEGDTGALDLLFSPSNSECVILRSALLEPVFRQPQRLLNLANSRAYAEYSISQAKKYGIKGSRLGALRQVWQWLQKNEATGRLKDNLDAIVEACGHEKYCHAVNNGEGRVLALCGKLHTGTIKMREFSERVTREMDRYGERAKAAEANQGLDFKALSHAMRALDQMEELLLTGRIEFPLRTRAELVRIKSGGYPWLQLEPMILDRIEDIDRLCKQHAENYIYEWEFARNFLLGCYGIC